MTLDKLMSSGLFAKDIIVVVRNPDMHVVVIGKFLEDKVLVHSDAELDSFVWECGERLIVDLKCDNDCEKCMDNIDKCCMKYID